MSAANQTAIQPTELVNADAIHTTIAQFRQNSGRRLTNQDGRTIARMIGVTIGVLVLAASADPFGALVVCLTFWLAGLLVRWPLKVLNLTAYISRLGFKSLWEIHLWATVLLLLIMVLFQQETTHSVQFWLLLTACGYHLSRLKFLKE